VSANSRANSAALAAARASASHTAAEAATELSSASALPVCLTLSMSLPDHPVRTTFSPPEIGSRRTPVRQGTPCLKHDLGPSDEDHGARPTDDNALHRWTNPAQNLSCRTSPRFCATPEPARPAPSPTSPRQPALTHPRSTALSAPSPGPATPTASSAPTPASPASRRAGCGATPSPSCRANRRVR
jgi:hypothetical protein